MPVPDENGRPYFDVVFGSSGNLTVVPDAIQSNGSISYIQGWGPFYSQDPTVNPATALFIDRAQTNQLFNDVTNALQAYQQFGTPAFITSSMNGGTPFSYAKSARVVHSGAVYQSLTNSNTTTPPSSSWGAVANGGGGVQGSAKNLKGIWASNTTATFSADQIVLQDGSGSSSLITAFSKTLNTGVSGAGGIDTGALANNTWYNVFAIYDGSTENIIFSLSATAPTLPGGYTLFARIGTFRIDGSAHIIGFTQSGSKTQYVVGSNLTVLPVMVSGVAGDTTIPTYVSVATGTFLPPTAGIIKTVIYTSYITSCSVLLAPNPNYSTPAVAPNVFGFSSGFSGYSGPDFPIEIALESSNIYYAASNSQSQVMCAGYQDNF